MKNPLSLLALLVAASGGVFANDTSLHDGRFGPVPLSGRESPVRMVAEHLEVEFGYRESEVHCTFTFRNTQAGPPVKQLVGFPDVGAAEDEQLRRDKQIILAGALTDRPACVPRPRAEQRATRDANRVRINR